MARASLLLSLLATVLVAVNVVAGFLTRFGLVDMRGHFALAVPTSIAALFAWMVVAFYFVGAFTWVQAECTERGLAASFEERARSIRNEILPSISWAVLTLMAAYILGGGADTRAVPPFVHLAMALFTLLRHVVASYRTVLFVGMMLDVQAEMETGAVEQA